MTLRSVAHDPANQRWLNNALSVQLVAVQLDASENRIPEARDRLAEVRPKIEALAAAEPADRNLGTLWVSALRLDVELRLPDHTAAAQAAANRAVDRADSFFSASQRDSKTLGECGQAYVVAGRAAAASGKHDSAKQHWQRVVDILQPRLRGSNDWRLLDPAARALAFLGRNDESRVLIARLHALGYRPLQPWPEVGEDRVSVRSTENQ